MKAKEFLQLCVPPICGVIKHKLFPQKEPIRHPMPMHDHKGDKMIVIGNGPSLNKTIEKYIDVLQHTECMMVNESCMTPLFETIKPAVYFLVDPVYFDEEHHSYYIKTRNDVTETLISKTSWPLSIIMPYRAKGCYMSERFKENTNIEVLFYEDGWNMPKHMSQYEAWDMNIICPPAQTVLNTAVWLAVYWGYKETYIVGADTSFMEDTHVDQETNGIYTIDTHFYENDDVYKNLDLWKEKRRYIPLKYHEEIETIYIILKSYWELREYADWKGVKVYNASEYSCIDAFERKKLN